jgi:hypothetical protein
MKRFTNLPGNLRAFFGCLRLLIILFGTGWLINFVLGSWLIGDVFKSSSPMMITAGEVGLTAAPDTVRLDSDVARPGSLVMDNLRSRLQVDLRSNDGALVSATRQAMIPAMAVLVIFSYLLVTSLRNLCANLEIGEVFSDENARLVRRVGLILIWYSVAGFVVGIWASAMINLYFNNHVTVTGLSTIAPKLGIGRALQFSLSTQYFPNFSGLIAGCLVLAISEAFKQGLNLKAENDLTV